MSYKVILWVAGLIIAGIMIYAFYNQLTRSSETYKAKEQTYHTFEPHQTFFGCARYIVPNK